jgi:hypothetical protein
LHLIGKTLLDRFGHGDYERVTLMIEAGTPELDAESRVFGCNHIDVALSAAERWGFPATLLSGVCYLTPPDPDDPDREQRACTAIAHSIAEISQFRKDNEHEPSPKVVPDWAISLLDIGPEKVDMVIEQGIGAIAAAQMHLL